jgi:hypothetical protein
VGSKTVVGVASAPPDRAISVLARKGGSIMTLRAGAEVELFESQRRRMSTVHILPRRA